jgi:mono/diheme cytochrome c family protein
MKKGFLVFVVPALMLSAGWTILHAGSQGPPAPRASNGSRDARAVVDRYCITCHNQRTKTSDLALDGLDLTTPAANGEVWEGVVRRLRTRSMPPQGMPRPDEATYETLASYLETELDRAASAKPNPGRPLMRRLNRSEYANAIRDLLTLEVDIASLLPPDDSAFGFDNISDLLGTSPALLERYLVAADRVSALAVGASVTPGSDTYRVRQDRSQDQHIEGLPLGTVGGLVVNHTFPVDAEYRFSLALYRTNLEAIRGLEHPHQIEITLDGERIFLGTVGGEVEKDPAEKGPQISITERSDAVDAKLQVRIPVKAGTHAVGATFVRKIGAGTQRLRPFLRSSAGTYDSTGRPHIETLTIAGPFNPTGPGVTASRERIFSCRPSAVSQEDGCAKKILSTLARRAYRRPVTSADAARLLTFYRAGRAKGDFDTGIQMALRRLLASPNFVFRVEENHGGKPGTIQRVSDIELASRLSFFLYCLAALRTCR